MVDVNDETMAPVWTAIRIFLLSVGAAMLDHGFTAKSNAYTGVIIAAGLVTTLGPAAWGVYAAVTNARRAKQEKAKAVQAGLNLAASGQMLDSEGKPITAFNAGEGTPPLPVTLQSASEIVKKFAPATAAK